MPNPSETICDDIELPAWHAHSCFRSTRDAIEMAIRTMPPLKFHAWLNRQRSAWAAVKQLLAGDFDDLSVVEQDQRRALEANGVSKAALGLLDGWFDAAQRSVQTRMNLSASEPVKSEIGDGFTRYTVRIPVDLYDKARAAAGVKSVNAEIVGALESVYGDGPAAFERHRDNRGYVAQSVLVELIRNLPVGEASRIRADLVVARAFEFSDELLRQNTYDAAERAKAVRS